MSHTEEEIKQEKIRHANQMDIFNPLEFGNSKILIVGAWGIGSHTVECLAKMWFSNLTVVDFDEVENHNIASQNYWPSQKGMLKVEALRENVLFKTWVEINIYNGKYHPDMAKGTDVVLMAVDNMDVRKEIADTARPKFGIIDWRMGWRSFTLYTFNPTYQMDRYLETWFPASEADPEICTSKAVSFNTYAIAGVVSGIISDLVQDKTVEFSKMVDLANYYMQ